jgi:hypothetical protein
MRIQGLAIVMVLSLLLPPAQAAILLVPANAQEIASVLGPDARGLHLRAAALPDLFTLTASRLDEDPKTFIVEQPYVSGHWQGGKAIIEYARDLSYTQVSIYDRNGNRQRIYSVRSKLEERTPPPVLVIPEIDAPFDKTPPPALSVNAPGDRPRRRHAVAVEEAAPDQPVVPVVAALPMTTPVTIVEPTPILVPVPKAVPVAPPPMATPKAVSKPVPKENPKPVVVVETPLPPPAPAVKSTQPPAVSEPITEETMGEGTHYEWDEAKGAYIPVNVKIIAPATPTSAPKVTVTAAAPAPMPVESSAHRAPAQTVGPPIDLHPAPESNENWAHEGGFCSASGRSSFGSSRSVTNSISSRDACSYRQSRRNDVGGRAASRRSISVRRFRFAKVCASFGSISCGGSCGRPRNSVSWT